MSLGQTVRLPELVLYDYRQDDSDNSLYHLKLRDGTGELMARAFPNNRNDNMRESLAESIACVGRGGIMHFPILANGSSAIYTPLTEEHPFYLVSFTRAESTEPSRRKEFELTPVKRFGDMHPDEL